MDERDFADMEKMDEGEGLDPNRFCHGCSYDQHSKCSRYFDKVYRAFCACKHEYHERFR